jgi:Asp-tRNA(Asn)/Glu-tRNA(Gln) amidotransferase A subunit family amidase
VSDDALYLLSANEALSKIKSNKISVTQYVESLIFRINQINPQTFVWSHLNFEQTLEQAKNLDTSIQSGIETGTLCGIPIGIKDIFNTVDFPTEMGSNLWKDFTPGNDSRVVHYLRQSDAIIMGKTETAEFAVHALGKSQNPYDFERSPGTSSSGSAIAVATFMVPLSIGTQTAGSIIRPASYCGVFGFKPSFGLLPRTGMLKTTDSLDQIGFFARTPKDLELIFDSIHVKGKNYPLSHSALNDTSRQTVSHRPWKIKFVKTHTWKNCTDSIQKSVTNFIQTLSTHPEFEIDELELPSNFELAHENHKTIYTKSLSYYFKEELKQKSLVSEIFYDFSNYSKNISLDDFDKSISYQSHITNQLDDSFRNFDIILSLSTVDHAPLRNNPEKDDPSLIWTMCGVPAINIPVLFTENELPVGIQVIARKYNDKLLMNFVNLLHKKNIIFDAPYPNPKLNNLLN